MTGPPRNLPARWHKPAEDLREEALTNRDPEIRQEMETIARIYERLAVYAERRMSDRRG